MVPFRPQNLRHSNHWKKRIMKIIIKVIALAAVSVFMTVGLMAQAKQIQKGQKKGKSFDILKVSEELGLSVEQKAALWDLQNEMKKERKNKGKAERTKESRDDSKAAFEAKLNEILTEDQAVKLATIREAHEAERAVEREAHKAEREKVKMAIQSYQEDKITPVLAPKRAEFDKLLTPDEKELIASLREQKELHKEEVKMKRGKDKGDRTERKENKEAIKSILDKYETELDAIWTSIEPNTKVWKEDMKQIMKENAPDKALEKGDGVKGDRKRGMRKGMRPGQREGLSRARFVLMEV